MLKKSTQSGSESTGKFENRPQTPTILHFVTYVDIGTGTASGISVRCKRSQLAYLVMAKIQHNLEQGKSTLELELAKRWQLP